MEEPLAEAPAAAPDDATQDAPSKPDEATAPPPATQDDEKRPRATGRLRSGTLGAARESRRVRSTALEMMRGEGVRATSVADLLEGKSFFDVFGVPGVALLFSFGISSAILLWLVVNGFRVYAYSTTIDENWYDDRLVRNRFSSNYDYSNEQYDKMEEIIYSGFTDEGWGGEPISRFDYLFSDNYKATQWKRTYKYDNPSVAVGIALTALMTGLYVWQCWREGRVVVSRGGGHRTGRVRAGTCPGSGASSSAAARRTRRCG